MFIVSITVQGLVPFCTSLLCDPKSRYDYFSKPTCIAGDPRFGVLTGPTICDASVY